MKIFTGLNFAKPSYIYLCIAKKCSGKIFTNEHRKKISVIKVPMRVGGEIGENFLLAKISTYTVSVAML